MDYLFENWMAAIASLARTQTDPIFHPGRAPALQGEQFRISASRP